MKKRIIGIMSAALMLCAGSAWAGTSVSLFNVDGDYGDWFFNAGFGGSSQVAGGVVEHASTVVPGFLGVVQSLQPPIVGPFQFEYTITDWDVFTTTAVLPFPGDFHTALMLDWPGLTWMRFIGAANVDGVNWIWAGFDGGYVNASAGLFIPPGVTRITVRMNCILGAGPGLPGYTEIWVAYDDDATTDAYRVDPADLTLVAIDNNPASPFNLFVLDPAWNPVLPVTPTLIGAANVAISTIHLDTLILEGAGVADYNPGDLPIYKGDDEDGDGLTNEEEDPNLNGIQDEGETNIYDADSDGDGTDDATDEFPLNPDEDTDSDGDGIGDNFEMNYFGDMDQDETTDFDGDQVGDLVEFEGGTDPTDPTTAPGLAAVWPIGLALLAALLVGVALLNVRRAHAR